jgi:hypothetical protein
MKRPRKLIEVTWLDAHTVDRGGWCDESDLTNWQTAVLCTSLGYLMGANANVLKMAASLSFDQTNTNIEQVSGTFVVPRAMIKKIRVLK